MTYSDTSDLYKMQVFNELKKVKNVCQLMEGRPLEESIESFPLELCQGEILDTFDFFIQPFEEFLRRKKSHDHDNNSSFCCSGHGGKDGASANSNDAGASSKSGDLEVINE